MRQLRAQQRRVQLTERVPLERVEPEEQQQHRPRRQAAQARKGAWMVKRSESGDLSGLCLESRGLSVEADRPSDAD